VQIYESEGTGEIEALEYQNQSRRFEIERTACDTLFKIEEIIYSYDIYWSELMRLRHVDVENFNLRLKPPYHTRTYLTSYIKINSSDVMNSVTAKPSQRSDWSNIAECANSCNGGCSERIVLVAWERYDSDSVTETDGSKLKNASWKAHYDGMENPEV
jgi:hypothetical protein